MFLVQDIPKFHAFIFKVTNSLPDDLQDFVPGGVNFGLSLESFQVLQAKVPSMRKIFFQSVQIDKPFQAEKCALHAEVVPESNQS